MKKPIILVALLVVVGLGGYLVYDNVFSSEADEEFTLDSATTGSTADPGGADDAVDDAADDEAADDLAALSGTWTVGPTSEAGYRIVEDTPMGETTVTGRTSTVEGSVTLAGGELTATEVVVDLASVASDQPLRDTAFRDTIMKTSEFPTATFRRGGKATRRGITSQDGRRSSASAPREFWRSPGNRGRDTTSPPKGRRRSTRP